MQGKEGKETFNELRTLYIFCFFAQNGLQEVNETLVMFNIKSH
jgi:hypothetical protein